MAALANDVSKLADGLWRLGLRPGRPALLASTGSLDFVRAYLALLHVGAPVLLVNPAVTSTELDGLLGASDVSHVFSSGAASDQVPAGVPHTPLSHLRPGRAAPEPTFARSTDVAVLATTSGTTGLPKLVPLRHSDLLASIRGAMLAWHWHSSDTVIHALPLFHQHGLSALHASILSGSSLHCRSSFDPDELLDLADTEAASILLAVPAMWRRLVNAPAARIRPQFRLLVSGSAPLPASLFEAINDAFGVPVVERYGTTESGLNISNLYLGPRRAGEIGLPLPGVETAIDAETAELYVRGPQLFGGYADMPPLASHDWFPTGDMAQCDPGSGMFTIVGRTRDLIISGGMNVYPREVEAALATHKSVTAAAVIGTPSARWGEKVTAFVETVAGADVGDLIAWAKLRVSPHKVPKAVHVVDELPRNDMGKIDRKHLKSLVFQADRERIS